MRLDSFSIEILGPSHCVNCNAVKKFLDKNAVHYTVVDITECPDRVPPGVTCAPCILVNGELHHTGFRPDKLKELVNDYATWQQPELVFG